MKSAVLIGCGNIGFRHLQAMLAMSSNTAITVVEPNPDAHERILAEFARSGGVGHRLSLHSSLPSSDRSFDLAVVAMTAAHRRAAVEGLLAHCDVRVVILEKVLFQTVGDIEAVGALLAERSVAAFVNCGRRSFAGYQQLRDQRGSMGPASVLVRGQRLGLASNAIHFLDLAEFLNDSALTSVDLSGLVPGSIPGKHTGCVEIFGTVRGTLMNGAKISITSLDVEPVQVVVEVSSAEPATVIDELARTITRGDTVSAFSSQNVSETPEIYEGALDAGRCLLTPYVDSARQHVLFVSALRDHLGLSNDDDVPCPIS